MAATDVSATKGNRGAGSTLAFVQKVSDNRVYAQNIVANMTFTIDYGEKNISAPGSLRMRKDKMIRLQLFIPLIGTEVGRIDFTPDYVLVVDRLHKQYVKGGYSQLDFLRDNGLDFYSLQSLFWNQLLLPGTKKIGESDLRQPRWNRAECARHPKIQPAQLLLAGRPHDGAHQSGKGGLCLEG